MFPTWPIQYIYICINKSLSIYIHDINIYIYTHDFYNWIYKYIHIYICVFVRIHHHVRVHHNTASTVQFNSTINQLVASIRQNPSANGRIAAHFFAWNWIESSNWFNWIESLIWIGSLNLNWIVEVVMCKNSLQMLYGPNSIYRYI